MNPSARRQTSRNRDNALRRLNSITTGTAIAAAVATAGFGALAASNYSGVTDAVTTDGAAAEGTTSTGAVDSDTTGSDDSTTNPVATPSLQPTSAPVAATTEKAKVTSGGSH